MTLKDNVGLKIASFLLLVCLVVVGFNSEEIQAGIRKMLVYLPLTNQVLPIEKEFYQLERAVNINLEEGYIKVLGCQIEEGNIELKLTSNLNLENEEGLKIEDKEGKIYRLETNGTGIGQNGKITFNIEAWGKIDRGIKELNIITAYGKIPVICSAVSELKSIDEIGEAAYDQEIYITVQKEALEEACKENNMDIEEFLKMNAYSTALKEFWETPLQKLQIKVPQEDRVIYNEAIKVGEYMLKVLESYRTTEGLVIEVERPQSLGNESIEHIKYSFDLETYESIAVRREGNKDIVLLETKVDLLDDIILNIGQVSIRKEGDWIIQFEEK